MKLGDLVQRLPALAEYFETNIGIILHETPEMWVLVMWDDGTIFVHNKDEFKVISEGR